MFPNALTVHNFLIYFKFQPSKSRVRSYLPSIDTKEREFEFFFFSCKQNCGCQRFLYAPGRPEEFGEFWLPKRRDFDRESYRMKCRCQHTHEEHAPYPSPFRCTAKRCSCLAFTSASICAACDMHWEEHDTIFETEQERQNAGRQISKWFCVLELPTT